ncbi:MAG: transglutaminase domain-containing protein [Eubacterium sp.]|nr:transglutaminase domain-containing protein [Eubacterium sp.]
MNPIDALKTNLPTDIAVLKSAGYLDDAQKLIDKWLTRQSLPQALRARLRVEKEILKDYAREYPYPFDTALAMVQKYVPDFTAERLHDLKDAGYADWILVDGKIHFQERFLASMIKTHPDYAHIELEDEDGQATVDLSPVEILEDTLKEMIEKGHKAYYTRIRHNVTINPEAQELGKTLRVYLPLPQNQDQISNIEILEVSPKPLKIADDTYGQRTVCFEKPLEAGDVFTVEYAYENHAEYIDLDPAKVDAKQPDFETQELAPHIVFTPYIKALADEIVGDETNPLIKARKIYDFITTKVNYSYVREYINIENIVDYAATNLKGDCGVQALLFITLCRCVGIPAKWQSGMYANPATLGNHDWAMFYVAPYGWLHCDCSFGGSGYRAKSELRWNFYFGNLEPFRMSANSEFQLDFDPPKKFLRADPYDNQRGECEYEDRRLTFHDFTEDRQIVEMHPID